MPYWLIAKYKHSGVEILTTELVGGERVLPVFSFEEEARLFLECEVESGWQIRKTGRGELVSILSGPCRNVERVALDPLPKEVDEMAINLVSLSRESFVYSLLANRRFLFHSKPDRERMRPTD